MKLLVTQTLAIAHTQVGVREIAHGNTGPEVDKYLQRAGVAIGEPWCAAFEYWCVDEAALSLQVPNPLLKTGYCPDIGNWARRRGALYERPKPGDIFLQYHGDDFHHTGLVKAVIGNRFTSIEGNTNDDGSREGDGVYLKQGRQARVISDRYRFVRWSETFADVHFLALFLRDQQMRFPNGDAVQMPVIDGAAYCPVRPWALAFGFNAIYDAANATVALQGHVLPGAVKIGDSAYLPIRVLARDAGLRVAAVDAKSVTVAR